MFPRPENGESRRHGQGGLSRKDGGISLEVAEGGEPRGNRVIFGSRSDNQTTGDSQPQAGGCGKKAGCRYCDVTIRGLIS